jgi:hypothetical protein
MKKNKLKPVKLGLLNIITGIVICAFLTYHVAYQIGKFKAHIENNQNR